MQCIFISFLFNTAPITFVLRGKRDFPAFERFSFPGEGAQPRYPPAAWPRNQKFYENKTIPTIRSACAGHRQHGCR